jgi:hypothetical protein
LIESRNSTATPLIEEMILEIGLPGLVRRDKAAYFFESCDQNFFFTLLEIPGVPRGSILISAGHFITPIVARRRTQARA